MKHVKPKKNPHKDVKFKNIACNFIIVLDTVPLFYIYEIETSRHDLKAFNRPDLAATLEKQYVVKCVKKNLTHNQTCNHDLT